MLFPNVFVAAAVLTTLVVGLPVTPNQLSEQIAPPTIVTEVDAENISKRMAPGFGVIKQASHAKSNQKPPRPAPAPAPAPAKPVYRVSGVAMPPPVQYRVDAWQPPKKNWFGL